MRPSRAFLVLAVSSLTLSSAALADPAPRDNVVVFHVTAVELPTSLPGQCHVTGAVREVWDGSAFGIGQPLSLDIPCAVGRPMLDQRPATRDKPVIGERPAPVSPAIRFVDTVVLKRSQTAVVHLDDYGKLIWTPTAQAYNRVGPVAGYVVLSESALPLAGPSVKNPV